MGDLSTDDRSSDAAPTIAPELGFRRSADRRGYHCTREHRERCGGGAAAVRPLADELLTARQAFTSGLNVLCLLAAALSVAPAEDAVLRLHEVPTTSESNSESDVSDPCP
jgi:hypothetical protein